MISEDRDAMLAGVVTIRGAYTSYDRLERILTTVGDIINRRNGQSEGPVHALIGMTRSGKSHLLRALLAKYPRPAERVTKENGDFAYQIPVVYVKFTGGRIITLLDAVYTAITGQDPAAVLGKTHTQGRVYAEILRHRRECGVKMLILDEAHQSVLNRTPYYAVEVAKVVKDLSNDFFSVLLVGTAGLRTLIDADDELQARCHKRHRLQAFERNAADMEIWTEVLNDIDDILKKRVFGVMSGLAAPDLAEALMTASKGLIGHAATLIENAAKEAVNEWDAWRSAGSPPGGKAPPDRVGWSHFRITFSEWGPGDGRLNPFDENVRPPEGGSPVAAEASRPPDDENDPPPMSKVQGRTPKGAKGNMFKA